MSDYHIRLFGTFDCSYMGSKLQNPLQGKPGEVFCYLLLHIDRPVSRKQVAFKFWPDSTENQAHTKLRKVIHYLKKHLPSIGTYVELDQARITWKKRVGCYVDVLEFFRLSESPDSWDWKKAVEMYAEELCPGAAYEWIDEARKTVKHTYATLLRRLIAISENRRDYAQAQQYAFDLLRTDNYAEDVHLKILQYCHLLGKRSAGMDHYRRMEKMLDEDLGIRPSMEVRKAYERLKTVPPETRKHSIPLIGRQEEWNRLLQAWRSISSAGAFFLLIEGEAGIGKSRLVEEFSFMVSAYDAIVYKTSCYSSVHPQAYGALKGWIDRTDIAAIPESDYREVARVGSPSGISSAQAMAEPLTGVSGLQTFYKALTDTLTPSSPTLYIIEDLQWCDGNTFQYLEYFLQSLKDAPALVIATFRSGDTKAVDWTSLQAISSRFATIPLQPMTENEICMFSEYLGGDHSLTTEQLKVISGGIPLHILELHIAGSPSFSGSPEQVLDELIRRRLESLPGPFYEVMEYMALLKKPVPLSFILSFCSGNGSMILDKLERSFMIHRTEEGRYQLANDRIQTVLKKMMPSARKTNVHLSLAGKLEKDSPALYTPIDIAEHYQNAGNLQKSIPYYEKAARSSFRLFDHEQTIDICRKLMALLPENERIGVYQLLADTYYTMGDWKQAETWYTHLEDKNIVSDSALSLLKLTDCLQAQAEFAQALRRIERAKARFTMMNEQKGRVAASLLESYIRAQLGEFTEAEKCLHQATNLDETDDMEEERLEAEAHLCYEQSHYRKALELYKRQAGYVDDQEMTKGMRAYLGIALSALEVEEYSLSIEAVTTYRRLCAEVGDRFGTILATGVLGKVYMRMGWESIALTCFLECLQESVRVDNTRLTLILLSLTGHTLHLIGEENLALLILKKAEKLAKRVRIPLFYANVLHYLADVCLDAGRLEEAGEYLERIDQFNRTYGRPDLYVYREVMNVKYALRMGELSEDQASGELKRMLSGNLGKKDSILVYEALSELTRDGGVRTAFLQFLEDCNDTFAMPLYHRKALKVGQSLRKPVTVEPEGEFTEIPLPVVRTELKELLSVF